MLTDRGRPWQNRGIGCATLSSSSARTVNARGAPTGRSSPGRHRRDDAGDVGDPLAGRRAAGVRRHALLLVGDASRYSGNARKHAREPFDQAWLNATCSGTARTHRFGLHGRARHFRAGRR
ncbi:hypothetical protein HBB16_15975 [Pseudonocardia sp. MCCB 268]|nr:hypothetical protein [Pseudonocardia cytotoxica]